MHTLNWSASPPLLRGFLLLALLLSILASATIAQDAKPPAATPEAVPEVKVLAEIKRLNAKIKEIAAAQSLAEAVRTSALEDYRTAIAQLESAIALDREHLGRRPRRRRRRRPTSRVAARKHIITDQCGQFISDEFAEWCEGRGVRPRKGAVGKQGSIAIVERLIRSSLVLCGRFRMRLCG